MMKKLFLTAAIFLFGITLSQGAVILGGGSGTINQLDQWTSTSSPSAITQGVFGKPIKITGLNTGECLTLAANGLATTTGAACGSGSGGSSVGSQGYVQFASSTAGFFNATSSLFWDDTNGRFGIGTSSLATFLVKTATNNIYAGFPLNETTPQSNLIATPTQGTRNGDASNVWGHRFTVPQNVSVTALGRFYTTGNTQNHTVSIWDESATTSPVISGLVLAASASDSNGVKFVNVATTTLLSTKTYRIAVDEFVGGDLWKTTWDGRLFYNNNTTLLGYIVGPGGSNVYPSTLLAAGVNVISAPVMKFAPKNLIDAGLTAYASTSDSSSYAFRTVNSKAQTLFAVRGDASTEYYGSVFMPSRLGIGSPSVAGNAFSVIATNSGSFVANGYYVGLLGGSGATVVDGTNYNIYGEGTNLIFNRSAGGIIGFRGGGGGVQQQMVLGTNGRTGIGLTGFATPVSALDVGLGGMSVGTYASTNIAPASGIIVSGNVGVGVTSPSARLHVASTSEQFRVGYDTSNYFSSTVGPTGATTFNAVGATSSFLFSDNLAVGSTTAPSTLTVKGSAGINPFNIASSTGANLFNINDGGHIVTGGDTPAVSSCGTSPSISGNDTTGTVTVGTGVVVSCTITCAKVRANTPRVVGVVTGGGLNITGGYSAKSTSAVTFSFAATIGGGTFDYFIIE